MTRTQEPREMTQEENREALDAFVTWWREVHQPEEIPYDYAQAAWVAAWNAREPQEVSVDASLTLAEAQSQTPDSPLPDLPEKLWTLYERPTKWDHFHAKVQYEDKAEALEALAQHSLDYEGRDYELRQRRLLKTATTDIRRSGPNRRNRPYLQRTLRPYLVLTPDPDRTQLGSVMARNWAGAKREARKAFNRTGLTVKLHPDHRRASSGE